MTKRVFQTLFAILGFSFIVYEFLHPCSQSETWYRENVTGLAYSGSIVRKFNDPDQKDEPVFILSDSSKYTFNNRKAFMKAKPGDSIIKKEGTLKHILKRGGDTIMVFYPMCLDQEFKAK